MRIRPKAGEHNANPRTVLDLLSRIQKYTAHIGDRTFYCTSKTTPGQLNLFDAPNLPRPGQKADVVSKCDSRVNNIDYLRD